MNLNEFSDYILHLIQKGLVNQHTLPVTDFIPPQQLVKEFPFELGKSNNLDSMIGLVQQILHYSTNTHSKMFVNQLYGGADTIGMLGDFLTTFLNTSGATYEISPVFTLMEKEIINKMLDQFGISAKKYPDRNGVMVPGGSISNIYAFHCARTHKYPNLNTGGMYLTTPLKVFCSDQAHYSAKKAMMFTGLGSNHLITIPTDEKGVMLVDELEKAIKNHQPNPMMVIATAGSTVTGAFDPITELVKICHPLGIWVHVDAAWGGPIIFSNDIKRRGLIRGIDQADSITFNPHKMLRIPLQCSMFLTPHGSTLKSSFSTKAKYLFQNDKCYDLDYDMGEQTLQCGRHIDSLKLWLPWKVYGDIGFQKHVDSCINNAQLFHQMIAKNPKFKLVFDQTTYANVCFWYVPKGGLTYGQLHQLTPAMKEALLYDGRLMINYQPMKDLPNFFRMVFHDSRLIIEDLENILSILEEVGDRVANQLFGNYEHSPTIENLIENNNNSERRGFFSNWKK